MNRRTLLAGAAAITVLVVGAVLARVGAGGSETSPTTTVPLAAEPTVTITGARPAGPTRVEAGVPVGFEASEDGAVAAAVTYATASQRWLYFSDDELAAAVAALATPAAAESLTVEVTSEVALARDELARTSGRVWWLVRPLATRVEHVTTANARVSVWVVTILSATDVAAPQAEWLTVTVDLAWVDDDWRVDGVRSTLGPTPLSGLKDEPWTAARFDDTLDGFTRVDTPGG